MNRAGKPKRGRGRSRGRPSGERSRRSLSTLFDESSLPEPQQTPTPSTSNPLSDLDKMRAQHQLHLKRVRALSPAKKKELVDAKRNKQLARFLLPDAPDAKRRRVPSPLRIKCPMANIMSFMDPGPSTSSTTPSSHTLAHISPPTKVSTTPGSGGSMASLVEVESLSPAYWRGGIECSIEIEAEECDDDDIPGSPEHPIISIDQGYIKPAKQIRVLSDVQIVPPRGNVASRPASPFSVCSAPSPPVALTSSEPATHEKPLSPIIIVVPGAATGAHESRPVSPVINVVPGELSEPEDLTDDEVPEENYDQDMVSLAPAVLPDNFSEAEVERLRRADLRDDMAMRSIVTSPDLLDFNWLNDPQVFKGSRESFTGNAGPTFPLSDSTCPLDVFLKIWDAPLIDFIVDQTNKYAATIVTKGPLQKGSRLRTWTPTDRLEMLRFLAIYQFHSLAHLPVQKDYFKASGILSMPGLAALMTYNRFILLKHFLHFADHLPPNLSEQQTRLYKIQPLVDRLTAKFKSLYMPDQSIAIDESLLLWKGRLAFAQKIGNKAAKVGIKTFELCESATGYLWNFFVYGGAAKSQQTDAQTGTQPDSQEDTDIQTDRQDDTQTDLQPDGATAKVVYDLARPLFNLGHTLVMDNYYNSPLLARCLKQQKTDVLGTLRVNRELVPESIKSLTKNELRVGEIAFSNTDDLTILLWRDSNLVCMLSTFHKVTVAPKEKYGKIKYKPQAVLDYNLLMGGVDKKDQLLSAYPMERNRNQVWYKKNFYRLLNVSILNSYVIYKCKFNIQHRRFRNILAEALLCISRPPSPHMEQIRTTRIEQQQHRQSKERPVLSGNHFIIKSESRHTVCVWCRIQHGKKKELHINANSAKLHFALKTAIKHTIQLDHKELTKLRAPLSMSQNQE